jgi:hypothetical protein
VEIMAGRTGKMTAAELARRGPRMMLIRCINTNNLHIVREDKQPTWGYWIVSKSFNMNYLRKVKKSNEEQS